MTHATFPLTRLTPLALGALLLAAGAARAQALDAAPVPATAATAPTDVPTVVVTASADASAQGLPRAYAGGQVARGGRLGLLGNVDIMDAPFSATNYTQALIQDQQARSVADVVQNDPAVRVARGFGNYQELYVVRGFAVNSDDLAYNGLYGLLPRQFVASELLERVEVLRGANSFVNGAAPGGGGIGGAINLLPKRAPNAPLNRITAGVESGGQGYVAADVARRFGQGDRAGIRVNAVRRDGDTAIDREGRELSVFAVGLDYRGEGYRLSADIGHQDHKLTAGRPNVTVGGKLAVPAAPDADANFAQPWTRSNERDTFGTLRAEVDLPALGPDAVAWAAFGARSGHEFNSLALPTTTDNAGNASAYRFDNARDDTVRTGEIGARTKLRTGSVGHTISASASGFQIRSRNAYALSDFIGWTTNLYHPVDVAPPAATAVVGNDIAAPALTQRAVLSSFALADTLALLDDRLLLTVGARRQTIKDVSYAYGTHAEASRYDRTVTTPVAGIVYKLLPNLSVYANYAEALQQGLSKPTLPGIANTDGGFAPFVSRQKEVGVKYDGGKVGMGAALFTTSQPLGSVQDKVFVIDGQQRNRGLELTAFGMPAQGLRVLGGLTLLQAEQRRNANPAQRGKDVIGVPRTQLNVGVDWDVPGVPGLSLNARALATGRQYADALNTQEVASWHRLDVGANYATRVLERDVTVRARVDNVANRNYWASAGGYPNYGYLVLGAPRTVTVSASVDF
jgi:iron complex outermembrane receptor protein